MPAEEGAQRQALSGERKTAPGDAVPIRPENPFWVNGVKLVNGDWDCKDFLWIWACTESVLLLDCCREEPFTGFPGRASMVELALRVP